MSGIVDWKNRQNEDLVRKGWADGLSASQIAAEIPGATRAAVMGKVHRLGLSKSATTRRLTHANATHAGRAAPKERAPSVPSVPISSANSDAVRENCQPDDVKRGDSAWEPLPSSKPVTLEQLRRTSCRWPVELTDATEQMFCGCNTLGTYCVEHARAEKARVRRQHPNAVRNQKQLSRLVRRLAA